MQNMKMENQELFDRIRAMEENEMVIAVKAIPDKVLIDEYVRRHESLSEMVNGARRSLKMENSKYGIKSKGSDGQEREGQADNGRLGTSN